MQVIRIGTTSRSHQHRISRQQLWCASLFILNDRLLVFLAHPPDLRTELQPDALPGHLGLNYRRNIPILPRNEFRIILQDRDL